ncbi:hypothetical protein DIPPA_32339 [Diplonema papillatum]|nr:hypothetical protein DIPPA_32339 [Diplonema papillatum]
MLRCSLRLGMTWAVRRTSPGGPGAEGLMWTDGAVAHHLLQMFRHRTDVRRDQVERELQRLYDKNCVVGIKSLSAAVSFFSSSGQQRDARYFYERSLRDWPTALQPSRHMARMYAAEGDADRVVEQLAKIHGEDHPLSDDLCTVVAVLCAARGWADLARRIVDDFAQAATPEMVSWAVIATGCPVRAQRYFAEGYPGPAKWGACLRLCRREEDVGPAEACVRAFLASPDAAELAPVVTVVHAFVEAVRRWQPVTALKVGRDALSAAQLLSVGSSHVPQDLLPTVDRILAGLLHCCASLQLPSSRALSEELWSLSSRSEAVATAMLAVYFSFGDVQAADDLCRCKGGCSPRIKAAYESLSQASRLMRIRSAQRGC